MFDFGIQFWPWNSIDRLISYGERALDRYPFRTVWICDEFQYEDSSIVMAALAMKLDAVVGPLVTFPSRDPLQLAQRFASIAKLTSPGKGVAVGLGAGGAVQVQMIADMAKPGSVSREAVQILRALLAGEQVELASFPALASWFHYNSQAKARLYFPPPQPVPVYLSAGGPKLAAIAGQYADGAIFGSIMPRSSYLGMRMGILRQLVDIAEEARRASGATGPFEKLYTLNISICRDGKRAREWAKRNTSYGLATAYFRYPDVLDQLSLDRSQVAHVADAYRRGLGVDEAASRVSDDLLRRAGCVIAGTPEECIELSLEVTRQLAALGFQHVVIGVPLGPDVPEAINLISQELMPALVQGGKS